MVVIVLDVATENEAETEAALARGGYVKQTAWVKHVATKEEGQTEGRVVRALGVGRYAVTDCWGRCPD